MYAIITPVKNESAHILRLAKVVERQLLKPKIWVIVDDGSYDGTDDKIRYLERNLDYVKGIYLKNGGLYDPVNEYGTIIRYGINHLQTTMPSLFKELDYIGILDADIFLPRNYYEAIINLMNDVSDLGIASGLFFEIIPSKSQGDRIKLKYYHAVIGGAMVIRKQCLASIGGFPSCPAPDMIAMIKATKKGWKLGVSKSTYAVHLRPQTFKRFIKFGKAAYRLGWHPLLILLSAPYDLSRRAPITFPAGKIVGYLTSMIRREPKIKDQEILQHFGVERLRMRFYRMRDLLEPNLY